MDFGTLGEHGQERWFEFYNDSGEVIPPFACMRISAVTTRNDRTILKCKKPNTYGAQYSHRFNGPIQVDIQGYGICCIGPQVAASYDTADGTPAFGELWGPRDATWKLKKNTGGFTVLGNADATNGIVLVEPCPFLQFDGLTDAAHNKGATGTVSIYYGTGAGTDTGVNMAGVDNTKGNVGSGKKVTCEWQQDVAGVAWKIVAAECG